MNRVIIFILLTFLLTACTFQKRVYRNGFYVENIFSKKKTISNIFKKSTSSERENILISRSNKDTAKAIVFISKSENNYTPVLSKITKEKLKYNYKDNLVCDKSSKLMKVFKDTIPTKAQTKKNNLMDNRLKSQYLSLIFNLYHTLYAVLLYLTFFFDALGFVFYGNYVSGPFLFYIGITIIFLINSFLKEKSQDYFSKYSNTNGITHFIVNTLVLFLFFLLFFDFEKQTFLAFSIFSAFSLIMLLFIILINFKNKNFNKINNEANLSMDANFKENMPYIKRIKWIRIIKLILLIINYTLTCLLVYNFMIISAYKTLSLIDRYLLLAGIFSIPIVINYILYLFRKKKKKT
ncbi:MAG TPA: hypothetical protein PK995_00475 [Bacteroidia bacterium]|nr:hypothetical protein [Bacteroidia bacterium]